MGVGIALRAASSRVAESPAEVALSGGGGWPHGSDWANAVEEDDAFLDEGRGVGWITREVVCFVIRSTGGGYRRYPRRCQWPGALHPLWIAHFPQRFDEYSSYRNRRTGGDSTHKFASFSYTSFLGTTNT